MMRTTLLALAAVATMSAAAHGQTAAPPAASAAATAHYTTSDTDLGTIIDDPAAKAIVEKAIPGMTTSSQVDMARGMTLKSIQQYVPDQITDAKLAEIDAQFAQLPAKAK